MGISDEEICFVPDSSVKQNFQLSFIYHIIDLLDVDEPDKVLAEIMFSLDSRFGFGGIYFGGFVSFRRLMLHYIYGVLKNKRGMSCSSIAMKFHVSSRDVIRGVKCLGSSL